ncbi:MAG: hypothetical protein NT022_11225 [Deltaproteobacteria bacterium]|nr:hypothetical protein [Deltaproteobacteria bacterium]
MKRLVVFGLMGIAACGTDFNGAKKTSRPEAATIVKTGQTETVCDVDGINCTTTVTTGTGVIVASPLGVSGPESYTFLDTPDANLCLDAFIRQGKTLPVETVARTLDARSYNGKGIAIMDIETTIIPVLNVIHLDSVYSDVMLQFLNKNGFYCIVNNSATFSNVTIQRSCQAQMAEIEPITHEVVSGRMNLCGGFKWPWQAQGQPATTRSLGSYISEIPCIP